MQSPGEYSLGDHSITSAGTITGDWIEDMDGLLGMTAQMRLAWGSGGSSLKAYLQTSLDGGTTAVDIACVVFGAASETALLNFSALTPKITQVTPTDGAMTDDTAVDGILGTMFRVKLVSTGTYASQTVFSGRIVAR
jgi:hypothetical protein